MRSRILPAEEWDRIKQTPVMLFPYTDPSKMDVVVVEDEGEIVACMMVLKATHLEGLWVAPERRKKAGVVRALMRQVVALLNVRGEKWVFGGAEHDQMRGFIQRHNGIPVPMDLYALVLGERQCRL